MICYIIWQNYAKLWLPVEFCRNLYIVYAYFRSFWRCLFTACWTYMRHCNLFTSRKFEYFWPFFHCVRASFFNLQISVEIRMQRWWFPIKERVARRPVINTVMSSLVPLSVPSRNYVPVWLFHCHDDVKLENNLEREKRLRADVEKNKRKLESDLRSTQDTVEELEKLKRELEETVRK